MEGDLGVTTGHRELLELIDGYLRRFEPRQGDAMPSEPSDERKASA
jgi:hypothetical protein